MPKESVSILSYSQDSCPIPQFSPIRAVFQLGILFFLPLPQPGRAGWSWSSADFVKRPRLLAGEGRGNIWKENKSGVGGGCKKAIFGRVPEAGVACPGPLCANLVFVGRTVCGAGPYSCCRVVAASQTGEPRPWAACLPGAEAHRTKMLRRAARTWEDEKQRRMLFVLLILCVCVCV